MWFYEGDRQIRGPFTERDLERLMVDGEITAETRVRSDTRSDWRTVGDVLDEYWAAGQGADADDPDMTGRTDTGDDHEIFDTHPNPAPKVDGIPDAVRVVFSKYVTFSGRAGRPEFWWFTLFWILVSFGLGILDAILFGGMDNAQPFGGLWSLGVILPSLAVGARRLHDIGRSAWWLLISLVPVIGVVLIVFFVQRSDPGRNKHG